MLRPSLATKWRGFSIPDNDDDDTRAMKHSTTLCNKYERHTFLSTSVVISYKGRCQETTHTMEMKTASSSMSTLLLFCSTDKVRVTLKWSSNWWTQSSASPHALQDDAGTDRPFRPSLKSFTSWWPSHLLPSKRGTHKHYAQYTWRLTSLWDCKIVLHFDFQHPFCKSILSFESKSLCCSV